MREPLAPLSTARNAPGTRFCQVCNDFRPISEFKKNQNRVCQQHDDVPDPSGVRFCRSCQDLLPLSRFSVDQMRFLCRACTWKRTGKPARMRYRAKRAHTQRLWSMCYTDRGIFQQPRVGVTQTDIAKLLEAGSYTASDAVKLAVVPKEPQLPMGKENAVLVTREQRRTLLSKLAAGGVEAYMNEMVGGSYTDGMPEGVISGTEAASDVSQDEGVADTADTSEDSVSETDMDANVCCNFVEAANGVTDAADTTSDLVSEEAGYMDTGFMKACDMLPDIVALPVCV